MSHWFRVFSFVMVSFVAFGCKNETSPVKATNQTGLRASGPIGSWVPPVPSSPVTYLGGLGFVTADKSVAYSVHAVAADRASLYALFPDDAKYRAINASYVWYWGDGSSSTGPQADHVYQRSGSYAVKCVMDVGFRGGSVARVTASCMAEIVPLRPVPIVSVSPRVS